MKKWFWKFRYALSMWARTSVDLKLAWQCAEAGWEVFGTEYSPSDAVDEELSCWGGYE